MLLEGLPGTELLSGLPGNALLSAVGSTFVLDGLCLIFHFNLCNRLFRCSVFFPELLV